jgi:membrane fusion protein, multidrug efflux system
MHRMTIVIFGVLAFVSCGKKETSAPLPSAVNFATAKAEDVPRTIETFGNCQTIADVTLEAQMPGILLKFAVAQGAMVKSDDLIAEIDPAPYKAALQTAQGNLDSSKAKLADMQVTLKRQEELYRTKTTDLADLQTAQTNELAAEGDVLTAEGELATAQINLGYCTIKTPIDGKVGIYEVNAGNLVTANETKLINIQTLDPIYVNFTISENDFDAVREYLTEKGLTVEATIPGGLGKKITGKLTFLDNRVASGTGTLMLQATFPNPDALLWPGLFVNVRLILTTLKGAIVVPSPCVMIGQKGPYVFAVNPDNTVTLRQVSLGERQGDFVVISDGVKAGDRIVTAGQLGLDTGLKVNPTPWQTPATGK